jgi:hypothetical protein
MQTMKLLIMWSSPYSYYFLSHRSAILLSISEQPHYMSFR